MSREVSWNRGGIIWCLKDMLYLPKYGGKEQYRRLNGVISGRISMLHFDRNLQVRWVGSGCYRGNLVFDPVIQPKLMCPSTSTNIKTWD